MRYSIPVKFLAVLLCALALTAAFMSTLGIVQVADLGLYTDGFDSWVSNRLQWQAYDLAKSLTERFAVRALTNCSEEFLEELGYWYVFQESVHWTGLDESSYNYKLCDSKGNVLSEQDGLPEGVTGWDYQTVVSVEFPVLVTTVAVVEEIYGGDYLHKDTVYPALYDKKPVTVRYYESPEYKLYITLDPDVVMDRSGSSLQLIRLVYEQRRSDGAFQKSAVDLRPVPAVAAGICCLCGVYMLRRRQTDCGWLAGTDRSYQNTAGCVFGHRWCKRLVAGQFGLSDDHGLDGPDG